jgi:hypothetical protein
MGVNTSHKIWNKEEPYMAVLLSGDFHANAMNELTKITRKALVSAYGQELFNEIRYHIILGDGGFLWPGNGKRDRYNYEILGHRPFPVLCVIGNHEPILGRQDIPEADIGIGENVLVVREGGPLVAYLKRGKVYTIDGFRFLALGGALSVDQEFREPGVSWWEKEYWSMEEQEALAELLNRQKQFDYVLSHTGPARVNRCLFLNGTNQYFLKFYDEVAALNDAVDDAITRGDWFCGHWHKDRLWYDETLKRSYRYLYNSTAVLKDGEVIEKRASPRVPDGA